MATALEVLNDSDSGQGEAELSHSRERTVVADEPDSGAVGGAELFPSPQHLAPSHAKEHLQRLEPVRKKVPTIEGQRVMCVLEDTVRRMDNTTLISTALENLDQFRIVLGAELVHLLEEHAIVRNTYEEYRNQLDIIHNRTYLQTREDIYGDDEESFYSRTPKSKSARSSAHTRSRAGTSPQQEDRETLRLRQEAIESQERLVRKQLEFSTRSILRGLAQNPQAVHSLRESASRSGHMKRLLQLMGELRDCVLKKLLTMPVEVEERLDFLREMAEKEHQNSVAVDKLQTLLSAAIQKKEEEIQKKNDVIRKLQSDMHTIEKLSEEFVRRTRAESEKQQQTDVKNHDGKRNKMQQESSQHTQQLNNLINEHRENEQQLRRRKYQLETEVENWIQKYDVDMGEKLIEFETIQAEYDKEKATLEALEKRFEALEVEYKQVMEEKRIEDERRAAAEKELQQMIEAATLIQAAFRAFKARKALRKKRKSGKKKKGGAAPTASAKAPSKPASAKSPGPPKSGK